MCDVERADKVSEPESTETELPETEEIVDQDSGPEMTPDVLDEIPERLVDPDDFDASVVRISNLEIAIEELKRESYKDQIIVKMQTRIAQLEMSDSTVREFQKSIMLMYDLAETIEQEFEDAMSAGNPPSAAKCFVDINALKIEVENQLFSAGLKMERLSKEDLEQGLKIDIKRQRALRTIPTENPDEHLVVVQSVHSGFLNENNRPVRKEEVVVKKFHAKVD